MHEAQTQDAFEHIVSPSDIDLNSMSDEQFQKVVDGIPSLSNTQMRKYMKLMSRHKPGKDAQKSAKKAKARNKAKAVKASRKANRK